MIRIFFVALSATALIVAGCGQERPSAPAQPKPEVKAATESTAPASPAAPAPAVPPVETAKAAATTTEVPKAPQPAPAKPAAPAAPAKPAVKIPEVPETLVLAASQGKVALPHLAHAKLFPCATCHGDGTPGKIDLNKDTAHALCRDCHKAKGAGPTACGACHQK